MEARRAAAPSGEPTVSAPNASPSALPRRPPAAEPVEARAGWAAAEGCWARFRARAVPGPWREVSDERLAARLPDYRLFTDGKEPTFLGRDGTISTFFENGPQATAGADAIDISDFLRDAGLSIRTASAAADVVHLLDLIAAHGNGPVDRSANWTIATQHMHGGWTVQWVYVGPPTSLSREPIYVIDTDRSGHLVRVYERWEVGIDVVGPTDCGPGTFTDVRAWAMDRRAKLASAPLPEPTEAARAHRSTSVAVVSGLVAPDGSLVCEAVFGGAPYGMDVAVLDTARRARFRPAMRGGEVSYQAVELLYLFDFAGGRTTLRVVDE